LLKVGAVFKWGERVQTALDTLNTSLAQQVKLYHIDPSLPFRLYTDFRNLVIGAHLTQTDLQGNEHLCLAISRSLNQAEGNYCSFEGEMRAVVWAIYLRRPNIHGCDFTIVTYQQPLTYLLITETLTGKHARWTRVQEHIFTIEHRPGVTHPAHHLSRFPLQTTSVG
jgi:hypothetical protein